MEKAIQAQAHALPAHAYRHKRHLALRVIRDVVIYGVFIVAAFIAVAPVIYLIATSLKQTMVRIVDLSVFLHPSIENYRYLFTKTNYSDWLRNSLVISGSVTVLTLIIDSLAAYAFAKKRFKARDTIFIILLSTLMVPTAVTLLPTFYIANRLKIIDTFIVMIIPALANPVGVFMMRQFIQTIPDELLEAARIDGLSDIRIYLQIIIPLSVPGLAVLSLYTFMQQWGSYLWPLVVSTSNRTRPINPGLATFFGQYNTNWGLAAAGTLTSMVPMLIFFLIVQKYVAEGIAGGRAAKG
jgi:multiple sugar transport system permease protein